MLTSTTMLADNRTHDEEPRDDRRPPLRNHLVGLPARAGAARRSLGSAPRHLEGVLQLMSPSKEHEAIKSLIGRLVEVWCLEQDIEFGVFGSWTLENKAAERGVEPDGCYVFGDPSGAEATASRSRGSGPRAGSTSARSTGSSA